MRNVDGQAQSTTGESEVYKPFEDGSLPNNRPPASIIGNRVLASTEGEQCGP